MVKLQTRAACEPPVPLEALQNAIKGLGWSGSLGAAGSSSRAGRQAVQGRACPQPCPRFTSIAAEKRQAEAQRIREKYPDRIPVRAAADSGSATALHVAWLWRAA